MKLYSPITIRFRFDGLSYELRGGGDTDLPDAVASHALAKYRGTGVIPSPMGVVADDPDEAHGQALAQKGAHETAHRRNADRQAYWDAVDEEVRRRCERRGR